MRNIINELENEIGRLEHYQKRWIKLRTLISEACNDTNVHSEVKKVLQTILKEDKR